MVLSAGRDVPREGGIVRGVKVLPSYCQVQLWMIGGQVAANGRHGARGSLLHWRSVVGGVDDYMCCPAMPQPLLPVGRRRTVSLTSSRMLSHPFQQRSAMSC